MIFNILSNKFVVECYFYHTKWNAMQLLTKFLPTVTLVAVCFALQAQSLVEKADKQFEMHAYRLAAKSYETVLAREPNDLAVAARLADAYFHLNELDDAARWYAKALKNTAVKPLVHLNYGKVLMMLGLYDDAEAQFNLYRKTDAPMAAQYIKSCRFARNTEDNDPDYKLAPLSKANSEASEFGVSLYNNQLVWSSNRTDLKRTRENGVKNDWTGSTQNQLFISPIEHISGLPFKISFLKSDLKNTYNESNPSFSADGKYVVFMRNNFDDGERISSGSGMELSLFTANVNEDGNWSDVRAFSHNGIGFSTGFPSLSADGQTLYFASNRSGGQGGFDIYVCSKRGNVWAEPRNLGASVNSPGDEITPFIDGKTLYFSSDYLTGYGGYDIFKVESLGSEAVNLGTSINSSGDDLGLVFTTSPTGAKSGFFVSNRKGGKGKEDIYRYDKQVESANIIVAEKGVLLKDVQVAVTQGNEKNLSPLKTGNWILNLNDGKTHTIEVKKEGYKTKTVNIAPRFVKTTQLIEVAMEKDVPVAMSTIPQYKGSVVDGSTGEGIQDVLIKVTNQSNNTQTETTTDKNGSYKINLNTSPTYLITYSKEGFIISKKTVKISSNSSKVIEEIVLKPSALSGRSELIADATTKKSVPVPASIPTDYDTKPEKVLVKKTEDRVYSVQLFVSSSDDVLNLSKYDKLKSFGNIYISPEGGKQKVRLGVFRTRELAGNALGKVKAQGLESAYIVEETNEKAVQNNQYTPKPVVPTEPETINKTPSELPKPKINTSKPKTSATTKPKVPTSTPKVDAAKTKKPVPQPSSYNTVVKPKSVSDVQPVAKKVTEDKTFKVKVASMKKPEWFDDSKVATIWKIDQVVEGDLTVFIMDGIKTLQQAKEIKAKVKAAGYKDAKVVVKEGGKFKVVD